MKNLSKLAASLIVVMGVAACGNSDDTSAVSDALEATKEAASIRLMRRRP